MPEPKDSLAFDADALVRDWLYPASGADTNINQQLPSWMTTPLAPEQQGGFRRLSQPEAEVKQPEVQETKEIELIPGASMLQAPPVNKMQVLPPTSSKKTIIPEDKVNELIGDVRNIYSGITELTLPDGMTIKGAGIQDLAPLLAANQRQAPGELKTAPVPEVGQSGNFLDKLKGFASSEALPFVLGQLGSALLPNAPQFGQIGSQLALNRAASQYSALLRQGYTPEQLSGYSFDILSPEMKQQAMSSILEERRQGVNEEYLRGLTELAYSTSAESKARTAGELTREDTIKQANIERQRD